MKLHVIITTYNRPHLLPLIVGDLQEQAGEMDVDIRVYDDGSTVPYPYIEGITLTRFNHNRGKQGYYRLVNEAWKEAESSEWDLLLMLPDDVRLVGGGLHELVKQWLLLSGSDPKAAMLCPLLDQRTRCWTRRPRTETVIGHYRYYLSHWNDCAFITNRSAMEAYRWKLAPVYPDRWSHNLRASSGVGRQITLRAEVLRLHLYHVTRSLVTHDPDELSVMNPPDATGINRRAVSL